MRQTLFFILSLYSLRGVRAQPTNPAFIFRAVAQPGTTIAGETFTTVTKVSSPALNDAGEFAFVAYTASGIAPFALFTSKRIVASQGDVIDGKTIMQIPDEMTVAINNAGQVAYLAFYVDNPEMAVSAVPSGLGLFIDDRLISTTPFPSPLPRFTLTDDGKIITEDSPSKALDIFGRIRKPKALIPTLLTSEKHSLPFPINHRGQILIPVNFEDGFLLLLGTPVTH